MEIHRVVMIQTPYIEWNEWKWEKNHRVAMRVVVYIEWDEWNWIE